jgi:hypothetical protein
MAIQPATHEPPPETEKVTAEPSAADLIDARIAALPDWRGATLARIRALIHDADPAVIETVKWRKPNNPHGVPVWEHDGIVCTGEVYRDKVKLTFARGAALPDPALLFNAPDTGATRRAIDLHQNATLDEAAFKTLFRAAIALNGKARARR